MESLGATEESAVLNLNYVIQKLGGKKYWMLIYFVPSIYLRFFSPVPHLFKQI